MRWTTDILRVVIENLLLFSLPKNHMVIGMVDVPGKRVCAQAKS